MFKIYDGRSQFYQWDLDRKLIVEDASINQVHFCNRTDECSLVCEVYDAEGLRLVDVPNVLLQTDWRINVYGYDVNYTKHSVYFNVVKRSKPEDYVYTEEEVHHWEELSEKIAQIEENGVSDEKIASSVSAYLEENPVEVDLTGYATEEYVIKAIGEIPEPDLSDYATIKDVQDAIDGIEPGTADVDLSNYYTKNEVDSAIEAIELTPGPAGKDGADYVLTEEDKAEIAGMVDVEGGSAEVIVDDKTIKKNEDGALYSALTMKGSNGAYGGADSSVSGSYSLAYGHFAQANGYATAAFNVASANGQSSFATGYFTQANGEKSSAFGIKTIANGIAQMALGQYNVEDTTNALIVGNGNDSTRSNAFTVGFDGNAWAAGDITVGPDKKRLITADDVDFTGYATEDYVTDAVNQALVGDGADLSEYAKTADIEAKGYQTADQVTDAINEALGVIENGTY